MLSTARVGILEMNVIALAGVIAALAWSRAMGPRAPRARTIAWLAAVTLAAEVAAQAWLLREAYGAIEDGDPADKATRLARAVSRGLNLAALELAVALVALAAIAALAIWAARRATT